MKLRLSSRRSMAFGSVLLLAAIVGGGFWPSRGTGAKAEDACTLENKDSRVNENAALAHDSLRRKGRDAWHRTTESASAEIEADDDAPVRIGFVQASPDLRQWRVSIQRTPAVGEVLDTAKITIRAEALASPDDTQVGSLQDMVVDWETQGRCFEEAAAPRLKVSADRPMVHLRVGVIYDGTEIEQRTFSAENED